MLRAQSTRPVASTSGRKVDGTQHAQCGRVQRAGMGVGFRVVKAWNQNVANPQQNGRIGKGFELAEPYFRRDMERDFRIKAIFPDRDQDRNRSRKRLS